VIPRERMKGAKEHRVPLSVSAMAILDEIHDLNTGTDLTFLGQRRGRPLSDRTLRQALHRYCPGFTVHGMRSTFRDWCADTGKPADVSEAALAHATGNAVVRAYARSDLLEARRQLMQNWADFLTREPAQVAPLRQAMREA
jgi:integrase